MSDRDRTRRRPEESEVRDALRSLPAVRPEPEYRERMRRAFMDGSLEAASSAAERSAGRAADEAAGHAARRRRPFEWPFSLGWVLAPGAVAAVVLALALNRSAPWSVMDATGDGSIVLNGRSIAAGDVRVLNRSLGRHPVILVPDSTELVLRSDVMLLDLAPGTRATLPPPPGRWFGRHVIGTVDHGEMRIMTGDRFPGHRLGIRTSDGITELTGTIVSVYKADPLTCVCVLEGTASVGVNRSDMEAIPAGMRKVMFTDGSKPLVTEIEPTHGAGLVAFADKYENGWRTKRRALRLGSGSGE
jgi:hypothetical protein